MTLKYFQKFCPAVKCEYCVHQNQKVSTFTVNYMSDDIEDLQSNIIKRMKLEKMNAKVRFVSANAMGYMVIDVDLPEGVEFHV